MTLFSEPVDLEPLRSELASVKQKVNNLLQGVENGIALSPAIVERINAGNVRISQIEEQLVEASAAAAAIVIERVTGPDGTRSDAKARFVRGRAGPLTEDVLRFLALDEAPPPVGQAVGVGVIRVGLERIIGITPRQIHV